MIAALLCAAMLAQTPREADLETRATQLVAGQFESLGRTTPAADEVLRKAARTLALKALDSSSTEASELLTLTSAVSAAGGSDPSPRMLILKGSPWDEALRALQKKREDLSVESATVLGVGAASRGDSSALCILLFERRATVEPFPRALDRSSKPRKNCLQLNAPFGDPEVYVTRPSGLVDRIAPSGSGDHWCAQVPFPNDGRHTVEWLAHSSKGPEVVALFFVDIGAVTRTADRAGLDEPATPALARSKILGRINKLRQSFDLGPLAPDDALDRIAQAYAERQATEGFFAHIAPDGSDLRGRLRLGQYSYSAAGENLGLAEGPLAAHFGIEHSPGHRKNLIDGTYSHLGIGIARQSNNQAVVVEVMAAPTAAKVSSNPLASAYEVIDQLRKNRHLPALSRMPVLEQLALDHARKALAQETPKAQLGNELLHDRVFASRDDIKEAAVDIFVAESPTAVGDSKNALVAKNAMVGVGLVKGDSLRFGTGRYWIVVVYASLREP